MKLTRTVCPISGTIEYCNSNGRVHRLDGPAIIYPNGRSVWCFDGKYHRLNGPAIINSYSEEWWVMGKCHRLDGPAIIRADGSQDWWVNDDHITKDVLSCMRDNNMPPWKDWGIVEKTLFALRFR